ncbi:glucuronosyltransferase [Bradyrhizobium sp. WBOS7]|uniref:Glucuronosyltransferase n=1 Tax=Bradyrhizobium betae TaxID=244734 RepID=A0AAE9N6D5_9BRAD|nr:glucuronosyltransferase [Bradyrhizobium sp. WBOS2]MDD1572973.1 glucuronosyltransferase [Bradyrhizobium sp. WBOS1]MDD1579054.1 glucuronosyltransferase [Bradyrhizobium sp. WBOS7]MDD1601861.1 glucuronosyltransferase [Bradyrhizobium sp. WBOS16]UUO33167.1 glucuronosyltransferase [Bradyrhizobium sp. WBOS01]UUO63813.1 glucuronosyltransferase [Bradyrhizobium betae]
MVPFDRLIQIMDGWAADHPAEAVFAQIGTGRYEPRAMEFSRILSPQDFAERVASCSLVVAHAGMGSVISAAQAAKPIVLFPRRQSLREHNTDHQLDTVKWLADRPGIYVATDEVQIREQIARARRESVSAAPLSATAPASFAQRIRRAIIEL